MDKIKRNNQSKGRGFGLLLFLALLLAAAHIGLVSGRDMVTFHWPEHPRMYVYGIPFLFILFTVCFYLLFLKAVACLYRRDKVFLSYARYFLLYACVIGIFWILCWPGIFKGDEFYTITAALDFNLSAMQSGLTSLFYICALLFFPSMASITGFQLLIICSIFAVVVRERIERGKGKKRWLILLPFILLPVIDADLFTLRASLVGWLFLLLMHKVLLLRKEDVKSGLFLSALCGLIIAWRSEFIYLLLLLPLGFFLWKKMPVKRVLCCFLLILSCWQFFAIPNKIAENGQNKYPISLVLNPLANLFTEAESLRGPNVYEDIMTINELVDVRLLRQNASVRNISQYWNIDDVVPKEQLSAFMKAAIRLIAYNPEKFLKYRWQTFCYTNGFYPNYINHPGGEDVNAILSLSYYDRDYREYFVMMHPPLGQALREKTIELLALRTYEQGRIKTGFLLPVFYNVLWPLLGLIGLLVLAAVKKNRDLLWQVILVGVQFVLIFLTAPAMFFMYYFCLYLNGYCLLFFTLAEEKR